MQLKKNSIVSLIAGLSLFAMAGTAPVFAEVVREDSPKLEGLTDRRIYKWQDTGVKPKAVAIAVHGLVLHGGVYDKLARELASKGFVVVAPDLRGYGRWCPEHEEHARGGATVNLDNAALIPLDAMPDEPPIKESCAQCNTNLVRTSRVSYDKSYSDLKNLLKSVRNHYPSLPVYMIGESLGAGLAMHLAADMPKSIDGLVLSSPAIKRRIYMEPRMIFDLSAVMLKPSKEIDLVPYIRRFASEDPEVVETALSDPLVRKKLTMVDLLKTSQLIKGNIRHADKIPADMPVLVIQGDKDRMLRSNGVVALLEHLKSRDQTVRWFPGKGHLLLETPHIMPETVDTVSQWLGERLIQAAPTTAHGLMME